jgi:site-specific DNA-methyltransferase (adenine-specific)
MVDQLIHADCLTALTTFNAESIDLIYLDPPFNTGVKRAYHDHFGNAHDYIQYMQPRIAQMVRVLKPNGSLFYHCDWRASHYVKIMLDEVFILDKKTSQNAKIVKTTSDFLVNEIIWHYGLGAARSKRHLLTKHDVIFWYSKGKHYTFNQIREEPTAAMLAKYCHVDEMGKRYMMSYGKRYYLKGGKPLDDVWNIPAIAPTANERSGYPTQKPLSLLRRIVQLASNENEILLDPFCGSGTALVAAKFLNRRVIGIDISDEAINIAQSRLSQDTL